MAGQTSHSASGHGAARAFRWPPWAPRGAVDENYPDLLGMGVLSAKTNGSADDGRGFMALGDLIDGALCEECRKMRVLGAECKSSFTHLSLANMKGNTPRCRRLCKVLVEALEPSWHPVHPHAMVDRSKLSSEDQLQRESANVVICAWAHPQTPDDATYLVAFLSHAGVDNGMCTIRIYKSQANIVPRDGLALPDYRIQMRDRKLERIRAWMREDWTKWAASTDPIHQESNFLPGYLILERPTRRLTAAESNWILTGPSVSSCRAGKSERLRGTGTAGWFSQQPTAPRAVFLSVL